MSRSRGNVPFLLTIAALLLAVSSQLGHAQNASIVLQAKLAGNLNTKSAMVGDAIVAKTTNASVFKDGTDLPQGTKLIGKLVAVQSKQDGGGTSTLAIRFNSFEAKGVLHPVQGWIVAIGLDPAFQSVPGADTVMARGGGGSPSTRGSRSGAAPGDQDDSGIPAGSTLKGISLDPDLAAYGATELHGLMRDIKLDSATLIKVELK